MTKDDDDMFRPPQRSTASRMFAARSQSSVRGFDIAQLPAEKSLRQIIYESLLERCTLLLLLAMRTIWNVHDQPAPVSFVDTDGRLKNHTFDYRAQFTCGRVDAIAVKPEARAEKLNFRDTLAAIEKALPDGFANRVVLVTEKNLHPIEVQNAELLSFFRRSVDNEADAVVADIIRGLAGEVLIKDIVDRSGLKARGFRAVYRAIYGGLLDADRRNLIRPNTVVTVARALS